MNINPFTRTDQKLKIYLFIFLSLASAVLLAQSEIRGRIVSEDDKEPLPGATVLIKGTSNGSISDYDGSFKLSANPGEVLVVTYIGFVSKEVAVTNANYIEISLEPDIEALDEIIVIGYGTQKKSDITGSVASIRQEDFNPGPVVSVSNLLQSTAPGVVLTQSSAQPGGNFDINIRGASSVLGANGPLYVIDGFPITSDNVQPESNSRYRSSPPRNPLNGINPQDIVSVEILKDASATAIYGARGANGVVLITTKRGRSNKLSIEFGSSFSIQELDNRYHMLNATEYAQVSNEVFLANHPDSDPLYSTDFINNAGTGTDWIDEITRTGTIQQYQLSASHGINNLKYVISGNYYKHDGVVDVSSLERYSGKMNIDYNIGKLRTGLSTLVSRTNDFQIPFGADDGGGFEFAGLMDNTRMWSPLVSVRDADGNYSLHPVRTDIPNPVSLLEIEDEINTNRLLSTLFAEYGFTDNLSVKINLGIDKSHSEREALIPTSVIRGAQSNGEGEVSENDNQSFLSELTLTYRKKLNQNSSITILGGSTFQQFDTEGTSTLFRNFADQTTNFDNITNADTLSVVEFKERSRLMSFIGRINYSANDKYLFTFSFRADGSTKFGPNNKWGYFPSTAVAWKIHNESFFSSSFINELKLRVSYGLTGNQEIGNKRSQSLYNVTRRTVLGGSPVQGLAALRPENSDLQWESTSQFNLGLDFSLLKSRIYGSIDVYRKITDDVLLDFELPGTAGFELVTLNAGSIQNQGIELGLTSRNLVRRLEWTTSFNFAYNDNQWKDRAGFYPEGEQIAEENGPLGGIYGYRVIGLFSSQEEIDSSPNQSAVAVAQPGTFKYQDANGDGVVTPDDRVLLGEEDPDFTFGLNNSFTYKKFDLSFFFQGALGQEKENYTRAHLEDVDDINDGFNKTTTVLNRWMQENPDGTVPGQDDLIGGFSNNSVYIENASFIRLRNITFGYTFLTNDKISNLRIYGDIQNLLTFTSFDGIDPETDEFRQYPNAKTYTIGLNITL
ncbi:MAG: TonB-dependent receptor [Bacteroidota bacterium]